MNLKKLTTAISEYTPPDQVKYLNESAFIVNGTRVSVRGDVIQYGNTLLRCSSIKQLLLELFNNGLINCSAETISHIQNRYANLDGAATTIQFKQANHEYRSK